MLHSSYSLYFSVDSKWNVLKIVMMHDSVFYLIQDVPGDFQLYCFQMHVQDTPVLIISAYPSLVFLTSKIKRAKFRDMVTFDSECGQVLNKSLQIIALFLTYFYWQVCVYVS